jgi:FixJ family two-component response regulator
VTANKPFIAIVDDDESVGRALKRLVRSLGMKAETYASGEDFLDQIESLPSFPLDCVILDVQMAGMSGLEAQKRIRWVYKNLPIIFITAHDDRTARDQALAGGAVAFLRKPCNDDLLIRTLEAALGRGGAAEKTGGPNDGAPK